MHANGKRALVGAMSALMVATSMPAPALAAEVAGLGLQQPAAREQTAAAPAAEQKENASQQGKGQKAQAQDSTSSATQPGASGKTEAKNPASSAAAKRGQSAPAASAAQAVGKGQAAAAVAKPVEEPKAVQTAPQAPKFDLDQAANTYGMVSYEVQKADGTTECSESAIIGKDNVKSVSEPKQNADGSWTVTVTLKDGLTAANFNVPSWALSVDPSEYAVDPSASKLTVEFSTEPNGTSYSASGDARAKLVFKQAPAEQAPAAPTADWVATKANSYGAVDWKGDADQIFGGYLPAGTFTVGKVQKADDGSYYVDVTLNKDKASIDKVFSEGSEGDLKTYQFDADAQGNSYVVRFNWNKNTKVWELDTAHVATLTYNYNKPSIEWKNIDPAGVVGFRIDGDPADATVALKEGTYTSTGMSPNGDGTFSMSCELKEDSLQGYIDELNQQTGKHYVLADDADTTPFFSLRAAAGD